jgi:hypothetical protein
VWATALVREAEVFITARLAPLHHQDADMGAEDEGASEGGDDGGGSESEAEAQAGERGLGQFIAVHWRRGDRAYQEEMGIHGHADVALTGPLRMVMFFFLSFLAPWA